MHQGKHGEDKPLPTTVFYLKPQRSVIAVHIIYPQQPRALNCSVMFINAERSPWYGLKSKFSALKAAWLLLEQGAADAVRQSRLEEGAASAHRHEGTRFLWFIVSLLVPWHLERARCFPGVCKAGRHILCFAEVVL